MANRAGQVSEDRPDAGSEKVTIELPGGGGSEPLSLLERLANGSGK